MCKEGQHYIKNYILMKESEKLLTTHFIKLRKLQQ